ncbi:MAG TPA: adenylyl-sulfate kinase [Alphaproteobacteria bacterium]|jgi:bifunctional enzyme CysN/CysC|nr:adenylyl-sulfate kinase [Alphaproteobacteria bacterium]
MQQKTPSISSYLDGLAGLDTLRFITCGHVDDGKSTLIGRLLHDSQALFDDQLATLQSDSRRIGTQGEEIDFALLVDGLAAEREQGITIDIAWRFFTTDKRRFIIADAPGHQEYTRNMATAASTAMLAVILVDAGAGIREQTRRHAMICNLMGISQIIVAVNKIDSVGYDRTVFERIEAEFDDFASSLNFTSVTAIPISALKGDMVISRGSSLDWYHGPTLMGALELASTDDASLHAPARLPVQWVSRPDSGFRGYAGRIAAGEFSTGDHVRVLPSGMTTRIEAIRIGDSIRPSARKDESIMLTLADDISLSRGDVIASADNPPQVADQFEADLVWLTHTEGFAGRKVDFKFGTAKVSGSISTIKHCIDIDTGQRLSARSISLNDIACVTISLGRGVVFDPYAACRETGGFIIIDRETNETIGAGMIRFALRRASNIHRQAVNISRADREQLNENRARVYWFTGLSGSGKSTIANAFEVALNERGIRTYLLDGDNIRHGLNRDLGFTDADRIENIRRIAEVARLMLDAGLVVLTAFISPFQQDRAMARELIGGDDFVEVFVDTPLALCEERDVKGLYKKARAGEIPNFTGISSPYEAPENPECRLSGEGKSIEDMVQALIEMDAERG